MYGKWKNTKIALKVKCHGQCHQLSTTFSVYYGALPITYSYQLQFYRFCADSHTNRHRQKQYLLAACAQVNKDLLVSAASVVSCMAIHVCKATCSFSAILLILVSDENLSSFRYLIT